MRERLIFLVLVLIMFLAGSVQAATYYVDATNGLDSNDGFSEGSAWLTIQHAADSVSSGDTVNVNPGNYDERITITTSGDSGSLITFQSMGNVSTQGFRISGDYIKIIGFTATPTICSSTSGTGIYITGDYNVILNNLIYNAPYYGIWLDSDPLGCTVKNNTINKASGLGIQVEGTNHLIENNEVSGISQNNAGCNNSHDADGMRFFGSGHIFRGNYIHDIHYNETFTPNAHIDCFQTWDGAGGYTAGNNIIFEKNRCFLLDGHNWMPEAQGAQGICGFQLGGSSYLTIRNNIFETYCGVNAHPDSHHTDIVNNIFVNAEHGLYDYELALFLDGAEYYTIKNNIFYNQPWDIYSISGSTTGQDISNNLCYGYLGGNCYSSPKTNDLWNVDPLLVDPSANDFHLQATSPAIDAGVDVGLTQDFDGVSIPQGSAPDIGAFEYQGMTSSCSPADTSGDSIIDIGELLNYISDWKAGTVVIGDLLTAISEWKNGC